MDLKTVTSKGTKYQTRKRIGRGIGSGSGKTSGRGHKGQGSRSGASRKPGFEGGQMPLYRRVPKRGFTNARFRTEYTIVNVRDLEVFDAGTVVDLDAILAKGLTSLETKLLKVLGMGELTKKLTVKAQKFSKSAADKIVAAGGEVIELGERGQAGSAEEAPKKPAKKKKAATAKAPAEEAPVEPAAEEAPAEEAPVEEAPVEETPDAETEEEAGETDA
jgi:large subunit ribosomal protein L15